jgi:hypothetical protein
MKKRQTFLLDTENLERFKRYCVNNDLKQSLVVNRLIRIYLEKNDKP